jgi:predicted AAA+ superfamily ATPase
VKRNAEHYLKHWLSKSGRKPLVIRGARQVGKSTLVRNFAKNHDLDLVEINLERHKNLNKLFETNNVHEICRELEYISDKNLTDFHGKLLFLDEIQAVPEAIPCLRYFYEDLPGLAVISAGSLLEFVLSKHNFSMPVGRIEYLFLGPMNFIEFLEAQKQQKLIDLISNYSWDETFPLSAHERLLMLLRDFLIVGGMPEAVSVFENRKNLDDVIDIHLSIIETYQDDFAKYARYSQLSKIQNVFQYVPQAIGNKVKYSNIDPHSQAREVKASIDLLAKAGVITKVNHSNASGLPIGAGINSKIYKLYFLDVGLANTMCGIKHINLEMLKDLRFVNEGNIAEQFIAQHLLYTGRLNSTPELFYWLREEKSRNAEVDFLTIVDGEIIPVEVKAGKSGTLKSLHQFAHQKNFHTALRFDLNMPSRQEFGYALPNNNSNTHNIRFDLYSLPLYMVGRSDLCSNSLTLCQ